MTLLGEFGVDSLDPLLADEVLADVLLAKQAGEGHPESRAVRVAATPNCHLLPLDLISALCGEVAGKPGAPGFPTGTEVLKGITLSPFRLRQGLPSYRRLQGHRPDREIRQFQKRLSSLFDPGSPSRLV